MSLNGRGSKYRQNGASKESPYDRANLLSKYSLYFMLPLFKKGYKSNITINDIGNPPRVDLSRSLGLKLQHNYNQEILNKKEPSLMRALFKTFGFQLLIFTFLDFASKCIAFPLQTIAVGWLIRDTGLYLNTPILLVTNITTNITDNNQTPALISLTSDEIYWKVIYDAILIIIFTLFAIVLSHPYFFQTYHIGMRCRVAACYMIYKKSLRLSQSAMSETTVGQMVNLLSNDVNRFDQVVQLMPYVILAPLQAIIILTILFLFYLGLWPTLASFASIILYIGVQTSMGRGFSKFRARTAKRTDERVRLMNEIILAMRIIKMYAWEKPFKRLVYIARKREITTIGISSILKTINLTLFFVSSKIIVFVALITYVLLGNSFEPEIVFVSIGLANLVRVSLTLFFPNAIAYCAETMISCRRLNKFLMLPELENSPSSYRMSSDGYGCKYVVTMNKVYAGWTSNNELISKSDSRWAIIRNLTIQIKPRDLVLIVGRVGSGKSSVLLSILGELPVASGRLEVNGRISYACQEAWIFSGTVKENILFGKNFEANRYNEVIRVCSLERDLEILVDGDSTIVGERGVSLSGGQKARVNLARALYNDADVYLLDDPLSAVDAPVAKHIFNESLKTFLRKKTVILATHQLQFLRHATKVLVVDRNSPSAFGTLQEVMASEAFSVVDYSKEAFEDATTTETGTDVDAIKSEKRQSRQSRKSDRHGEGTSSGSGSSSRSPEEVQEDDRLIRADSQASSNLNESVRVIGPFNDKTKSGLEADDAPAQQKALKKLTGSERRQGTEALSTISTDASTYLYYASNAAGALYLIWFLLANILAQGLYIYIDFFLSFWTDSVQRKEMQGAAFVPQTYVDYLTINEISAAYSVLIGLCVFASFCRASTFFIGTLRASINIHDKLFNSVIHAPMTFFDFSPIGILLNRLSRDIGFVDETLPATMIEIIMIFVNIFGVIVLAIIIDYKNLGPSLLLLIVAFALRNYCSRTVTKLKQIEGVTRSPIYSHISTTLSGLSTIRAFKVQDEFVRLFDKQQDTHTSAWFNYICSGRWLTVAMDWLCLAFVTLVIALLLAFSLDATNASLVGLLISQAIVIPGPFQWGMRQLIEVESQMTSVQRIREFSMLEPEEKVMKSKSSESLSKYQGIETVVSAFKPEEGEVKFCNLTLSYFSDEPPVLKNLNFIIKPREKIGVVGRTGAGKSSIVSVLFRLYNFEGSIKIDGCDTKTMPLNELRRSMSIIPQDPILFGGTIRKNLDPFSEYSDSQLWDSLEAVQLKPLFSRYTQGLEFVINEGGSNFSVGQRQLICLARAIVRRNKILVLDEATANVDPETDIFIQRTIANQFDHCTVITIAHRLVTIVDSDRVLVLDRGEVREFAEPFELIKDENSLFSQMVSSSAQQAPRLRKLIEDHHSKKVPRLSDDE